MKMLVSEYRRVLDELGLTSMARMLGFPNQIPVRTTDEMIMQILLHDGVGPVFVSQNPYVLGPEGRVEKILVEHFFVELEGDSPEKKDHQAIHEELQRYDEWMTSHGFPYAAVWSGGGSIHPWGIMQREEWSPTAMLTRMYSTWTEAMAIAIKSDHIDFHCAEPKRLHRAPFTLHTGTGRRGMVITRSMIDDFDVFWDNAQHPRLHLGQYRMGNGHVPTIREFAEALPNVPMPPPPDEYTPVAYSVPSGEFEKSMEQLVTPMCLLAQSYAPEPNHDARVAIVEWFRQLHFEEGTVLGFIEEIAARAKWEEIGCKCWATPEKRRYQVGQIFRKGYNPSSTLCYKMYRRGHCVGERCSLFPELKKNMEK